MESIQTFNDVLTHLENNQIVMFLSPLPTYCVAKNDTIELISNVSRFSISLIDFIDLYHQETFYLHTINEEDDIDSEKDNEYYGLRYQ